MGPYLRRTGILLCSLTLQLGIHAPAQAEGSKQLTPNKSTTPTSLTNPANTIAGYLMHDTQNAATAGKFLKPGAPDEQRLFVRLKPGETLYYGLQRIDTGDPRNNQGNLIVTLKYKDANGVEQTAATTTLTRNTSATNNPNQSLLVSQAGVIDNATQNQAGPRTAANPAGYNPLTLTYPASATGTRDYWLELTQVGENTMNTDTKLSYYNFWDFTVLNAAGQEKPGRLFSKFWAFTSGQSTGSAGGYQNRLSADFNLFTLVPNSQNPNLYYVKEVELAGLRPYDFFFVANSKGTNTAGAFAESRKSVAGASATAEYNNFVNDPDASLWPSAPAPLFIRTAQAYCNSITGKGGVAFTTTSGENGSVNVLIDLNGNGGQDGQDVLLTQDVLANTPSTITWDGKDKSGAIVAFGTTIELSFTSFGAPVNYPLYDAEGNPDGLRIQNVRPSSGAGQYFDRLYWDDTNLNATDFPVRASLNGTVSTTGVHAWGDASNQIGNNLTINTWSYGFITPIDQTYLYEYACDNDNDGIVDADDLDDDNDGILDGVETNGVNPQQASNNTLVYLDAAYRHPVFGKFVDMNSDGINDWFDTDLDGIPNHFDLDSDNDGLPDAVEANGNKAPTMSFTQTAGTSSGNRYTVTSTYSTTESRFVGTMFRTSNNNAITPPDGIGAGVGKNGLPDAVEGTTVTYTGDRGSIDVTESATPTSQYVLTDQDNDVLVQGTKQARNYNFLDLDSDNDGITDELEALTTASYGTRKGLAGFTTDTNKNGLRDAYDPANGGTAISLPLVDTDADNVADIFDTDADGDNALRTTLPIYVQTADWTEGFADAQTGVAGAEIVKKARHFASANPAKSTHYTVTTNGGGYGATTMSYFLQDANSNGIPNFLEPGNSAYHDENFNGLIDLYDTMFDGAPSTAPRSPAAAPQPIYRTSLVQDPLPVTLLSFQARATGSDVLLRWATAQEVNSASYAVERSADGLLFETVGTQPARGTTSQRSDYQFLDKGVGRTAGTWYYRLLQLDQDGTTSRTNVSLVRFGNQGVGLATLYPNPLTPATVLSLTALPNGPYTVQVVGLDGRVVLEQVAQGGETLPFASALLRNGIYLVRVTGQDLSQTLKLVKK